MGQHLGSRGRNSQGASGRENVGERQGLRGWEKWGSGRGVFVRMGLGGGLGE